MLVISVILTFLIITVMITDITRFIIPNKFVLVILLLYPVMVYIAPVKPDWQFALMVAAAAFIVGFILFALKVMGGGDVKLLAVTSLYVNHTDFLDFIVGVAIFGGLLSIILIIIRPLIVYIFSRLGKSIESVPRVLTVNAPLPYGLAIGTAFLVLLWSGEINGIDILGNARDNMYLTSPHPDSYKPQ